MEKNANPPKLRHDWYETESHVFVNILCKNVREGDFNVHYDERSLAFSLLLDNGVKHEASFNLLHEINPSGCSHKITPSKIEIKLKKKEGYRWEKLETDRVAEQTAKPAADKTGPTSSSSKSKDWDKVVVDIMKNEEDDLEGDAALNALFQKIYSQGSDEVKKAMNKSFFESSGTVLSTNWGEVQRGSVGVKPPDGVEYRKWNS